MSYIELFTVGGGIAFQAMGGQEILSLKKRNGAYLPHWSAKDAIYFVTFRLAGSLPSSKLKDIQWEKRNIEQTSNYVQREITTDERNQLEDLHFREVDFFLRASPDARWLANAQIA